MKHSTLNIQRSASNALPRMLVVLLNMGTFPLAISL